MTKLRLFLIAAGVATTALCFTGCKTPATSSGNPSPVFVNPTNGIITVFGHDLDPVATGNSLKGLSQAGALAALQYDANSRAYLQLVQTILTVAIQNGQYDPAVLQNSLATISINEAHDPKVTEGINAALGLYSIFAGQIVTSQVTDVSPYLKPALTGVRDGIAAAVGAPLQINTLPPPSTTNVMALP